MNQATVLKILRILKREAKQMDQLACHAESPDSQAHLEGQARGMLYAIKTIEDGIKHE